MINIRNARAEDANILAQAEQTITRTPGLLVSRPHELNLEAFKKKINSLSELPNAKYVVAERQGQVVGHAVLDPMVLTSVEHVVRLTIAVHPGHEEQGIGEQLLSYLIEWAKMAPKVQKIELNVRATNLRAIRLYQKLGFNVEGRLRHRVQVEDGNFVDDIEMGLFVKGQQPSQVVVSLAIGKVVSERKEAADDNWDRVQSYVLLDETQFSSDALLGLNEFSHVEILFHMNQVDVRKVERSARHPRGNIDWPKVGIFAQRGKNRPNQLGATICRILKIEGLKIFLEGLDAIDGSPVLDIKPWVAEFGPRGSTFQPEWIKELMVEYWNKPE